MTNSGLKPIAIYLPQFHPITENNQWWGTGFTEWTNVTKAGPLFPGHYQPHLPADLGFYDLRLHETMVKQAELAKENGVYGFMFYHYWFSGKQLLERPVQQWLQRKSPNFPYCMCWANENWTRTWDGKDSEPLMIQEYSEQDDRAHLQEMVKYFEDDRYIKVDGKPVFAVYRTKLFPDIKKTACVWREEAVKAGLKGLYLVTVESWGNKIDPATIGFDASIDFQPDFSSMPKRDFGTLKDKILHKLKIKDSPFSINRVFDYKDYVRHVCRANRPAYKQFPGISPGWDNSARKKKNATILKNSSPSEFSIWLQHIVNTFEPYSKDESFVFINAWNEWAEGNHLEPCQKWGLQYLQALQSSLKKKDKSENTL